METLLDPHIEEMIREVIESERNRWKHIEAYDLPRCWDELMVNCSFIKHVNFTWIKTQIITHKPTGYKFVLITTSDTEENMIEHCYTNVSYLKFEDYHG